MSNENVWRLGDYLTQWGDQQPQPAALLALSHVTHSHPLNTLMLRRWIQERPEIISSALNDATPDEAALMLARLMAGGTDSRAIENALGGATV